ncbi:MAG TPA: DUF3109 family protein [Bacteroidales bacterium]|nr:DUF3109 family protein [Bacteroidales bacterium]HRZ76489.1 DUF3109 family protein [Bacteroidales bacterium]
MIIIDDTLVSEEIFDVHFICDLASCRGACCVEGDAGAPLEEEEIGLLEDALDEVKPFMTPEGRATVEGQGVFEFDAGGHFVTPLNGGRECAFTFFVDGEARCAIEEAFLSGKTRFRKPVSCHLYPIRLSQVGDHIAVNHHHWHICVPAKLLGKKEGVRVYEFLREPLIRRFGGAWYEKLKIAAAWHLGKTV